MIMYQKFKLSDNHTNNIAELTAINKSLKIIKENDIKLPVQLYTLTIFN